jgi:hypothetical protein
MILRFLAGWLAISSVLWIGYAIGIRPTWQEALLCFVAMAAADVISEVLR